MTIPTPIEGTAITAEWGEAVAAAINSIDARHVLFSGSTSGAGEQQFASLTIPAAPFPRKVYPTAMALVNSPGGGIFEFRIRVGSTSGALRAAARFSVPSASASIALSAVGPITVAAGDSTTVVLSAVRITGTSTVATGGTAEGSILSAITIPNLA